MCSNYWMKLWLPINRRIQSKIQSEYKLCFFISNSKSITISWRQSVQTLTEFSNKKLRLVPCKKSKLIDFTHINTKALYWMILYDNRIKHKTEPSCKRKWNQLFNIREEDWPSIFLLPFQTCRSTWLQSFQKLQNIIVLVTSPLDNKLPNNQLYNITSKNYPLTTESFPRKTMTSQYPFITFWEYWSNSYHTKINLH